MRIFWQRTKTLDRLSRYWSLAALGGSYWHQLQGVGQRFRPGELLGYFNDHSARALRSGSVDPQGVPPVDMGRGLLLFPTTVVQEGWRHSDCHLASPGGEHGHREAFLRVADWAIRPQDAVWRALSGVRPVWQSAL